MCSATGPFLRSGMTPETFGKNVALQEFGYVEDLDVAPRGVFFRRCEQGLDP